MGTASLGLPSPFLLVEPARPEPALERPSSQGQEVSFGKSEQTALTILHDCLTPWDLGNQSKGWAVNLVLKLAEAVW